MIGNKLAVLLDSLRAVVGLILDAVHTRIRLFGIDLKQELLHACSLIIQSLTTLLLACLTVGFIGLAVIVVFWDSHRVLAAALVATVFALLTLTAAISLKRTLARKPKPFHSTLEVLERDVEALRSGG